MPEQTKTAAEPTIVLRLKGNPAYAGFLDSLAGRLDLADRAALAELAISELAERHGRKPVARGVQRRGGKRAGAGRKPKATA